MVDEKLLETPGKGKKIVQQKVTRELWEVMCSGTNCYPFEKRN